jgi:hypothetical protein
MLNNRRMDKKDALKIEEMMKIAFSMMACSAKSCSVQKKEIMSNPVTSKLYMEYSLEKDINKKIKLLKQLNKHNIVYEYDACVLKNCKDILKSLINIIKGNVDKIPKTNVNHKKLTTLINMLNKIIDNPNELTKKEHLAYVKDMTQLMSSMS